MNYSLDARGTLLSLISSKLEKQTGRMAEKAWFPGNAVLAKRREGKQCEFPSEKATIHQILYHFVTWSAYLKLLAPSKTNLFGTDGQTDLQNNFSVLSHAVQPRVSGVQRSRVYVSTETGSRHYFPGL